MSPAAAAVKSPPRRERVAAAVLDQALAALRGGTLAAWLAQRPRGGARWLRRYGPLLRGAAGDGLEGGREAEVRILLTWLMLQLRPDAQATLEGIDEHCWLRRPAWRPVLAVLCHHGLLAVPDHPARYRRRPGEPAIDNLCGLWDLAPSTVYRDLERAQQAMLQIALEWPPTVPRRLSLRRVAADAVRPANPPPGDWHTRQAQRALDRHDAIAALWHRLQAGDTAGFVELLRDHAPRLAAEPEADALVDRVAAAVRDPRSQARLWLARAVLARTRNQPERDLAAIETALRIAQAAGDQPMLGLGHAAQGKYFEARDADRAFACLERSAELLPPGTPGFEAEALHVLIRLAWQFALRQHPRTRDTLERVDRLAATLHLATRDRALIDDAWGEFWRLSGDHRRAVECRQRALLCFEEAGDRRQVLATLLNLMLSYAHGQDSARTLSLARRFFAEAERDDVEPEMLVNAHTSVGIAHFFLGDMDLAAHHYALAVDGALAADLRLHANRNRYNLAEALYQRFARGGGAEDEARADALVAELLQAPVAEATESLHQLARTLKGEVLAPPSPQVRDRLLSEESAAHFEASSRIARERAVLAAPAEPAQHLRAHLAIAEAYLSMAARERDRALQLAERHGLQAQAAPALAGLRQVFEREQPREQRLAAAWRDATADLLDDPRRLALAARLLRDGALSKASYGEAAGVAPATASKHLALFSGRGLLVQTGRGPATRYRLAPASGSPGP